ncbi:MAG: hypothetical protein J6M34_04785 [Clostridia bacterium]|nr:hypothetical protein [Clostridia bacterium]
MSSLHFCPADGWFGDPMPLWHDGVYHVYYTKMYHNKKVGWGHISSTDLVEYTEHPDPFPCGEEGTPTSTGCVYWHDGKFHAYYAGKDFTMLHSESEDGITFTYPGEICFHRPLDTYRQDRHWRDPFVFYDEGAKLFRMVFCAKGPENGTPDCFAGRIGQAVSPDLKTWECLPPMDLSGIAMTLECPEIYRDKDRWVLIYYWHETRFRTAPTPQGPWHRGSVISPDHFDFMAARHMYDGDRHLLVGWLPRRNCDCQERIWGGNMLFPRELRMEDGNPKTQFAREINRVFSVRYEKIGVDTFEFCNDGWTVSENKLFASSPEGGTMAWVPDLPDSCLIRMKLSFSDLNGQALILLGTHVGTKDSPVTENGYQIMIDPAERLIRLRKHYVWDQRNDIAVIPYSFGEDRTISLEILRHDGILEVGVDGEQTLVSRLLSDAHGGLALSVQDTSVCISDLLVHIED